MNPNNDPAQALSSSVLESTAGGVVALLRSIRKHWALVTALTGLAAVGSLIEAKSQTKIYQTHSTIEVDPHVSQPLGGNLQEGALDFGVGFTDAREYYETQYKLLTSDRVLGDVVRDLSLLADPDFGGVTSKNPTPEQVQRAIGALRGRIAIEPIKGSRLVMIKVEDRDPKRAKRVADGVATTFVDDNLSTAIASTSDAVVWLNGQLDHVREQLEENENALHAFKEKYELPSTSINDASNMYRLELQSYAEALTKMRTEMQSAQARNSVLSKLAEGDPDDLPTSELFRDDFLQNLRAKYIAAQQERRDLLAEGKGDSHPLVKRATDRVTDTRSALIAEIKHVKQGVARDLAIIQREEAGETELYEQSRHRAVDLNMKEIEYHRLDRTREQSEKVFAFLLEKLKGADLARMMRVNNLRVVDPAPEPEAPIRPRVGTRVWIGGLIGLLLGVFIAWLRDQLDSSVKTPDDVESKLGVTFLGLLPKLETDEQADKRRGKRSPPRRRSALVGKDSTELAVHERPLSGIAEAARAIRTNLLFTNPDRPLRTLLVSSAAPNEGKTTVACSIAIAFAQGGQKTCIVDCDLRRPRIHNIFGRAGDMGVTNVLVGDAEVDDVAKITEVPNLWCIPAGPVPPSAADMLQSARFRRFIEELTERFDRVIMDSPPLIAVTDAAIMSKLADGTVFVVRAFKTNRQLSRHGLRSLQDVGAPIIGAVLNWVDFNRHEYSTRYYHYAYYKREGYNSLPSAGPGTGGDGGEPPGQSPPVPN
jgi:succinoglycan biosynthesis transport protein ExoP